MITFKHSLIISSWLISAGSAACLSATSPCWPWTAWGRSRCWVSWCLSGWWYDAWSPAGERCWRPPLTPCWCTGSWSGRETWETVVGVIAASQKQTEDFFEAVWPQNSAPAQTGSAAAPSPLCPTFHRCSCFWWSPSCRPRWSEGWSGRRCHELWPGPPWSWWITETSVNYWPLELLLHQIIWINRFSFWPMLMWR